MNKNAFFIFCATLVQSNLAQAEISETLKNDISLIINTMKLGPISLQEREEFLKKIFSSFKIFIEELVQDLNLEDFSKKSKKIVLSPQDKALTAQYFVETFFKKEVEWAIEEQSKMMEEQERLVEESKKYVSNDKLFSSIEYTIIRRKEIINTLRKNILVFKDNINESNGIIKELILNRSQVVQDIIPFYQNIFDLYIDALDVIKNLEIVEKRNAIAIKDKKSDLLEIKMPLRLKEAIRGGEAGKDRRSLRNELKKYISEKTNITK
ncbi:hypothetical protein [Holospora undulata]|uniref:Uncharacterized protein n=1 Tax=Holospora undulata HU1 TaxID=1321371 RepID=A0A061JH31_9PROT|nr:hypothetical protein [Holospora undulata]ETZ05481.1 hypothetical protein K737_300080 [Holospora undulata HU1]